MNNTRIWLLSNIFTGKSRKKGVYDRNAYKIRVFLKCLFCKGLFCPKNTVFYQHYTQSYPQFYAIFPIFFRI